ncbi:predicted protein [Nematostella vectensis]|uniref:Nuclear cap-binding protein subunit 1 n=1 Tax=Nematostella vectensis TaxID=45351 RepID=A7ST09_NEMVE|nr:predicted protein [Nematostella vectensis]|eukprot:XP_001625258.1 predicted protein [Nematostella vectensis]
MSRDRKRYYDDDGGRARKRRRTTEIVDIEDRLESLITRVGEKSTSSLESNLEGLANVLEADLPNYKERILSIICTCAANLPEKISIYSTLVGLLNVKTYKCGEEFLDMMINNIKDVMANHQFERARLMIRFMSDLVNCRVILPISLIELFEKFMAASMESDVPQVRTDWFVYCILSALPWTGKELSDKKGSDLERLLTTVDSYISQRKKTHIPALRVWSTDDVHPQEEYLDCLWAQIKKLKADGWQEKHIRRPYLSFDSVLGDALQHTIPPLTIPPHTDDTVYPLPTIVYRMFDYTDVPEGPAMPGAHSIERFLVEEGIRRVINAHYKDRKECANQLMNMPGKSKVPFNYCIIEVIFSELFRLPSPPHIEVFYASLFIELCKLQPESIPGILAQATYLLFDRLDTMNTSCVDRLKDWLSHHLSNFNYKWSWDEWIQYANSPGTPKFMFLCELFEKLHRFSYHDYLLEILPDDFLNIIPPKPLPSYRFSKDGLPGGDIAKQLTEAIRAKKDPEELQALLNEISTSSGGATGDDDDNDDVPKAEAAFSSLRIDVFLQTILYLGSKSISHSYSALTKFHKILKSLIPTEEAQIHALKTLKEFWCNSPQMTIILVDKLIRMQVVECTAVINWLLCKDMSQDFTKSYTWELMTTTIRRMNMQVNKVREESREAKDQLTKLEERSKKLALNESEMPKGPALADDIEKKQQHLEEVNERLENAQREQKQFYLILFQRFILMLTEHMVRCEQQQIEFNTLWFRYSIERFREVLLGNNTAVFQYLSTFEGLLFTTDLDPHILEVYKQFKALRA